MKKWFIMLAFAVVLFAGVGLAKISVASTGPECIEMYPGDSITKNLRLEVDESGWYTVVATGGMDVTPSTFDVYLEEDEPEYRVVTIHAPVNVSDDYFTVVFTLYNENGEYVDDMSMCFHVTKYGTVGAGEFKDFVFGAEDYYEEDGYFMVPLYVENTGSEPISVEFSADYTDARFTKTAVTVQPGRTEKVIAKIPSKDDIPAAIEFRAMGAGMVKKVVVRFSEEATEPDLEIAIPREITLDEGTTVLPVRVVNYGDTKVRVKAKLKDAPFGVGSYSEYTTIYPKQEKTIEVLVSTKGVLTTGERVARVCLLDEAEVEVACKYVTLNIPSAKSEEVQAEVKGDEKIVSFVVENGPRAYNNAIVDVEVPEGWKYKVEPEEVLDIPAYESVEISVHFAPTDDAKDGVATIYLKSASGDIIAKKTVDLSKSEITGYGVLGGVSPAWIIVGIIVLAVLIALFSKGGTSTAGSPEIEELKAELKKK